MKLAETSAPKDTLGPIDFELSFQSSLRAEIPRLRAFARGLCAGDLCLADDIAQEALAKAWKARKHFQLGTNFRGWLFTILRNEFYSCRRRSWRNVDLDPEIAERTLVDASNPTAAIELDDLRRGLAMLADDQREALILVGAGGVPYEEAADILGVPVGTVKSRVSRARTALAQLMEVGTLHIDGKPAASAMSDILGEVNRLKSGVAGQYAA